MDSFKWVTIDCAIIKDSSEYFPIIDFKATLKKFREVYF